MNSKVLFIPTVILKEITSYLESHLPEEACGLLGGKDGTVTVHLPISNILHSESQFKMDPEAQLRAFLYFEEQGLDLVAIYHSHPYGPVHPSATDLRDYRYPGVISVIVAKKGPEWSIQAYEIKDDDYTRIQFFDTV